MAAQLLANGVLRSSVPATISYEPPMLLPGDTPTDPVLMIVLTPLKFADVPARIANAAHDPRARGTSVVVSCTKERLFDVGRVTDDPLSKDTAVNVRALPVITELSPKKILVCARIFPTKLLEYPMDALDPTAQKTFSAFAPFSRMNEVVVAVVKAVGI